MESAIDKTNTKDAPNTEVLAFLVESFGDKIKTFLEGIEDSYKLLSTLGEKDSIAQTIEDIHYQPEAIALKSISNGKKILSALIHKELKENLFVPNGDKIEFLLGGRHSHTYFVKLKQDTDAERDFFMESFYMEYQSKPISRYMQVDLEFVPEGMGVENFIADKVTPLNVT